MAALLFFWFLVWLIVFALFPGIISAFIFESKGSEGFSGFVFGFIFSWLAVFVALIMPYNNYKINERNEYTNLQRGKSKQCPYCAENIKPEAIKCRHCGENVPKVGNSKQLDIEKLIDKWEKRRFY